MCSYDPPTSDGGVFYPPPPPSHLTMIYFYKPPHFRMVCFMPPPLSVTTPWINNDHSFISHPWNLSGPTVSEPEEMYQNAL